MGTLRPLARSVPPACPDEQRKLSAKHETRYRIQVLWPDLSWRARARKLRVDESTLRNALDVRAMNKQPSAKLLDLLEWHEQIASLSRKIGAAG